MRNLKVFLFDEPDSNLDAKLRARIRTEIKKVHHIVRTTTIRVTHDQVEAMTLADLFDQAGVHYHYPTGEGDKLMVELGRGRERRHPL